MPIKQDNYLKQFVDYIQSKKIDSTSEMYIVELIWIPS